MFNNFKSSPMDNFAICSKTHLIGYYQHEEKWNTSRGISYGSDLNYKDKTVDDTVRIEMYSPNDEFTTKHRRAPSYGFGGNFVDIKGFAERKRATADRDILDKFTRKKYRVGHRNKLSKIFQLIKDRSKIQRDPNEVYQRGFQKFRQLRVKQEIGKFHVKLISDKQKPDKLEFVIKNIGKTMNNCRRF
jgi:hypothetical protein